MKSSSLLFFLVAFFLSPQLLFAQDAELRSAAPASSATADAGETAEASVPAIHITDVLLRSPEGRASLRNYVEAKEAGFLSVGKGSIAADTIGQEKDFNVQTSLLDSQNKEWTSVGFTLRATNAVANVWVETSLDGSITTEKMNELEEHILSSTPAGSLRPDRGIIANDNEIFGSPPNFDGDGKVDILLHDIDEGEDKGCCVLGYVSAVDVDPLARDGQGNKADVLYIDLPNGIKGGVVTIAGTIAHEYQHLIHLNYQDSPGQELTFVNEGLSEWAEIMNGYFLRAITYLQDPAEHSTPLLEFRVNEPVDVRDNDYQRSGLFTTYIAERIGWEATGSIVQAKVPNSDRFAAGAEGYEVVLQRADLSLVDVVADFHTANFVNEASLDTRFGYSLKQRQAFVAKPTSSVDGESETSASTAVSANGGAMHYLSWTNVADLQLQVKDSFSNEADARANTRFRIFSEPVDGSSQVIDLDSNVSEYQLDGGHSRVTLIVANTDVSADVPIKYTVSSEWTPAEAKYLEHSVAYENGKTAGQPYFVLEQSSRQASFFEVPRDGRLATVHVAPVYTNQFIDSENEPLLPPGLPRDFKIHVWADDGTGLPGDELFSMEVVDDPTGTHLNFSTKEYSFLEVALPEDDPVLAELPSNVYVGISNAGADENYLALTSALYSGTDGSDRSFLFHEFSSGAAWAPFSAIGVGGEPVLEGRVLPIRVQFLIATADEDEAELPESVVLAQNYPNPFNPTTSIEYSLPRPMHVRLDVYNALGRRVATLADGVESAGAHTRSIDAAGWASGVYFYTLQTETHSITRQMIVLK